MQKDPLKLFHRKKKLSKGLRARLNANPPPIPPPPVVQPVIQPTPAPALIVKSRPSRMKSRPKRRRSQNKYVAPTYYDPKEFSARQKLAPSMKIFMYGSHASLISNERRLFEKLGHKPYSILDAYPPDVIFGKFNKIECNWLTQDDVGTIAEFCPIKADCRTRNKRAKQRFIELIDEKFDVVYVTQLAGWLRLFKNLSKPIIFRTYGRNNGAVQSAVRTFDDLHVVPVHHEEETDFSRKVTPILASVEDILEETRNYARLFRNAKEEYYLTVHRQFYRMLSKIKRCGLPKEWPKWKIVAGVRNPIPRDKLMKKFAQASVYMHLTADNNTIRYSPLEAIASGTLVVSPWGRSLWRLQERWGLMRSELIKTFYGSIDDGLELASYFSKNRNLARKLAAIQHKWLLWESRRAKHQWNKIFSRIEATHEKV